MTVKILPSAKADLKDGYAFYERQEEGVGAYFLDSLLSEIDSLTLFAGVHSRSGDHYRFISKRFPYWIYYRIKDENVYVTAILDARQDPKRIQAREDTEQ